MKSNITTALVVALGETAITTIIVLAVLAVAVPGVVTASAIIRAALPLTALFILFFVLALAILKYARGIQE